MKTGFIAVVGLANAGKSTLINSLVGKKVSIVSPLPQTTREPVLGIATDSDSQMVFVDTPGFFKSKNVLGDVMLKYIDGSVQDVDCILVVIDGHDGIDEAELAQISRYEKNGSPIVVAVTKTDITQKEKLLPELSKLNSFKSVAEVYCVSAVKGRDVSALKTALKKYLGGEIVYFPDGEKTDRGEDFQICEIIREKILLAAHGEVPHGVAVVLNHAELDESNVWDVNADIIVEKRSHKPILLGKGGETIKKIGKEARLAMEKLLGGKVFLTLYVRVKEDWRNDKRLLAQLGFDVL